MDGEFMGMTNKQFQGFIRLMLDIVHDALTINPDNPKLITLRDTLQDMLED